MKSNHRTLLTQLAALVAAPFLADKSRAATPKSLPAETPPIGGTSRIHYPGGREITVSRDPFGRVTEMIETFPGQPSIHSAYSYQVD